MQTIGYLGQDEGRATFTTPAGPPGPPEELLLIESLNNLLRETRNAEAVRIANDPGYTREQREGHLQRFSPSRYRRYLLLRDRPIRPPPPPLPGVDPQLQMDWMALINHFLSYRRVGLSNIASDTTLSLEQKEEHLRRRSRSTHRAYQRQKTRFRRQSAAQRARTIARWARIAARRPITPPPGVPRKKAATASQQRTNLVFLRTRPIGELRSFMARETSECKTGRRRYPSSEVRRYFVAAAVSAALDGAEIPRRMMGSPPGRIQDINAFIDTMVLPTVDQFVANEQCWLDPRGRRNMRTWRYLARRELRARKWQDARVAWRPTAERLIRIARGGGRFRRPDWIYTPGRGRRPAFVIPPEATHAVR